MAAGGSSARFTLSGKTSEQTAPVEAATSKRECKLKVQLESWIASSTTSINRAVPILIASANPAVIKEIALKLKQVAESNTSFGLPRSL